ncbi:ATP-grasp domain-containing protein [Bacillus thuringiensis]|nr:ATP-grasp domain-containing protein [Bacillus thuringiensis]
MKRILLVGAREEVLKAAKNLGFEVILFEKKERVKNHIVNLVDEIYIIDWEDHDIAVQFAISIHNQKPIDIVFSFGERGVKSAALIKEKLNIVGNDLESVNLSKDKRATRQRLNDLNVSTVNFRFCECVDNIEACAHSIGFPIIIKPNEGTGSNGVTKFDSTQQLSDFIYHNKDKISMPVIIEEFLDGEEVSVEAISFKGCHYIVAITKKFTTKEPNFIEIAHELPLNLDEKLNLEIELLTKSVLNAIKHEVGPSHTEIKLTKDGPKVIETHVRPGGDKITDLLKLSYGIDVFYQTLSYLKDNNEEFNSSCLDKHSSVRYILLPKGKITKIRGIDFMKKHPQIVDFKFPYGEGDFINQVQNSKTRHGYFIIIGRDSNGLHELVNQIKKEFRIDIDETSVDFLN